MFADRPVAGLRLGLVRRALPRARERQLAAARRRRRTRSRSRSPPSRACIGLAAYGAVLFFAFQLLFGRLRWRSRRGPPSLPPLGRTIVAAAFTALVFHTMTYAAFLEDPITWTLIGLGIALRLTRDAPSLSFFAELPESFGTNPYRRRVAREVEPLAVGDRPA